MSTLVAHGATAIFAILLALLVITVGLTLERLVAFSKLRSSFTADLQTLQRALAEGDLDEAREYFADQRSAAALIATAALQQAESGVAAVEKATAGAVMLLRHRLERGLHWVATIANNAPFVGLLGTVIGIIAAFQALGSTPEASVLMGAISECLVATAVGLLVALPAVAAYNHCQRKVDALVTEGEVLASVVATAAAAGLEQRNGKHRAA